MEVSTPDRQFVSSTTKNTLLGQPTQKLLGQAPSEYSSTTETSENVQSIFESYHPLNEAKLLQKYPNLTHEEKNYYLQENMLSYLEEFVAQVPYKQINGVLKVDGSLEMMGMSVMDMYRKTAELTGPGSREWHEWQGLQQIHQGLRQGHNRAVWISPPKLANYGFMFNFIAGDYEPKLKGRPIKELILRYGEEMGETKWSRYLADSVTDTVGHQRIKGNHTENYLSTPIIYSNSGYEDITQMLHLMDIHPQAIQRSEIMRNQIFPQLRPFLAEYQDLIHALSQLDLTDEGDLQVQELNEQAKVFIGSMFNGAKKLLRGDDKDSLYMSTMSPTQARTQAELLMMAQQLAYSEALVIQGGSNCPVATGSTMDQMTNLMTAGFSFDTGIHIIGSPSTFSDILDGTYKWKFDQPGTCRKCNGRDQKGMLGPCLVCKICQNNFDTGVYK